MVYNRHGTENMDYDTVDVKGMYTGISVYGSSYTCVAVKDTSILSVIQIRCSLYPNIHLLDMT